MAFQLGLFCLVQVFVSHLNQMINHKGCDPSSPPLRMNQQEGDVGFVIFDIRHHEAKSDHHFLIKHHDAEIRVLQALGQVHTFEITRTQSATALVISIQAGGEHIYARTTKYRHVICSKECFSLSYQKSYPAKTYPDTWS